MRVLVVDDHSLFRDGIISLLDASGFDLVLLDIHMPEMNGLDALKQIKSAMPETRVVMLTVSEDETFLADAIKLGADGYLLKHLSAPEFIELLEGLKRGEAAITRKTTAFLMKQIAQPSSRHDKPVTPLSDREVEIIRLLAEGLSNRSVSERLSLSENTIKYHLKNILQKLNVQNRTEAVMYAVRNNLIERP
jgi:DNA-binding NarL/FixJ family response regulator